jgi:hypothetical protein
MALAGHNSIVAPTGQEEVQYKVLTEQFGLADMEVRNWTNGPGFLTWSRGQNSHGNGIAGPLPRSFMKSQWALQKQILARYRELGIAGHQPAFGGFAPWALAEKQNDTHRATPGLPKTEAGKRSPRPDDTAWLDVSRTPSRFGACIVVYLRLWQILLHPANRACIAMRNDRRRGAIHCSRVSQTHGWRK